MEHRHHPVRPGTAIALRAQALPPPTSTHISYIWLGMGLLLTAIAAIGFTAPALGVLLAAGCSFALLWTAKKAKKQV
ncbi:MAG: hypothetical protein H7172_11470 [Ferruginibacter sp.]|nr:hypothetical protein [Rhodoferax sp.]